MVMFKSTRSMNSCAWCRADAKDIQSLSLSRSQMHETPGRTPLQRLSNIVGRCYMFSSSLTHSLNGPSRMIVYSSVPQKKHEHPTRLYSRNYPPLSPGSLLSCCLLFSLRRSMLLASCLKEQLSHLLPTRHSAPLFTLLEQI